LTNYLYPLTQASENKQQRTSENSGVIEI